MKMLHSFFFVIKTKENLDVYGLSVCSDIPAKKVTIQKTKHLGIRAHVIECLE